MGLSKYGLEHFDRYMRNSFIRDPTTKKPAFVVGHNDNGSVALQTARDAHEYKYVKLEDFSWDCAEYPELGYRNIKDGMAVLWLARKPGRTTTKGLRPEVVVISVPEALRVSAKFNMSTYGEISKRRVGWDLADIVYDKKFVEYDVAVSRLLDPKDKAVAFALSPEFAIVTWPLEDANLALYYAGQDNPAALSLDGKEWTWLDACVSDVATRKGII